MPIYGRSSNLSRGNNLVTNRSADVSGTATGEGGASGSVAQQSWVAAAIRGTGTPAGINSGTAVAPTIDPATQVGDDMWCVVAGSGSGSAPTAVGTGWTPLVPYTTSGASNTHGLAIYRKLAESGDAGSTVSITLGASAAVETLVISFVGPLAIDPASPALALYDGNVNTSWTVPNITPSQGTELLLAINAIRYSTTTGHTSSPASPYTELIDAANASSAPQRAIEIGQVVTGTAPGSVTFTVDDGTPIRTVTYLVGLSVISQGASAWQQSATDDAGVTDSVQFDVEHQYIDNSGTTDSSVVSVGRNVAQTDDSGATDSLTTAIGRTVTQTDDSGATDSAIIAVQHFITVTDDAGVTDPNTVSAAHFITATDSAGAGDSVAESQSKVFTDDAGVTDSTIVTPSHVVTATDDAGVTDSAIIQTSKAVSQTDSAGPTDSLTLDQAHAYTDVANLTDSLAIGQNKGFTDDSGATDTFVLAHGYGIVQVDSSGATDLLAIGQGKSQTDSAGVTDSAVVAVQHNLFFTDNAGPTDSLAKAYSYSFVDDAGVQDTEQTVAADFVTQTDSAGVSDSLDVHLSNPNDLVNPVYRWNGTTWVLEAPLVHL